MCAIIQTGCTKTLNYKLEYDKGIKAYKEKNYDEAIINFSNALNHKPDSYSALCYLGTSYIYKKDEKTAEQTLKDAIRLFPDEWNAYIILGDLKRTKKDYLMAVEYYEIATSLKSMGGREKSYYKNILKEIKAQELSYKTKNSFKALEAKEAFKAALKKTKTEDKNTLNKTPESMADAVLQPDMTKWEKVLHEQNDKNSFVQYALKGEDFKNYK
jgi:tetratricopeptide (TPR) repeat protein